jgi:hypothetical protein
MASDDHGDSVLAYRTTDDVEARALDAELHDAGVETYILREYRGWLTLGIELGSASNKEIWVKNRDHAAAERVVTNWGHKFHPKSQEPPQPFHFSLKDALIVITTAALGLGVIFGPEFL